VATSWTISRRNVRGIAAAGIGLVPRENVSVSYLVD
jgi:hypothetical protein